MLWYEGYTLSLSLSFPSLLTLSHPLLLRLSAYLPLPLRCHFPPSRINEHMTITITAVNTLMHLDETPVNLAYQY